MSYVSKINSREAWLRRLQKYWTVHSFPQFISRTGEIYEVDFGMNVGLEFSGRHLAVCLQDSSPSQEKMLVVPITTKINNYNISSENIVSTISNNGKLIQGGVAIGEARYISKLRIFRVSKILEEDESVENPVKGKIKLTKSTIKKWSSLV
jgi:mRNA-degrading endonuclease toxin of MazEF toxin-antitoxin module